MIWTQCLTLEVAALLWNQYLFCLMNCSSNTNDELSSFDFSSGTFKPLYSIKGRIVFSEPQCSAGTKDCISKSDFIWWKQLCNHSCWISRSYGKAHIKIIGFSLRNRYFLVSTWKWMGLFRLLVLELMVWISERFLISTFHSSRWSK